MPGDEEILKDSNGSGEKKNATAYPCFYYARHMQPGLAEYENERILVDTDNLKEMISSFVGKPIVVLHQDIELENLETRDGTVIESFYNGLDGWLWTKMLIETDAARAAIEQGWSVSNCYAPTEWGGGGTHHNVPYDRKIVNGIFKHLALVPNPRYEDAKVFTVDGFKAYQEDKQNQLQHLQNSKNDDGDTKMIKFFKNKKEEISQVDENSMIELDGKEVSLKEVMTIVTNAKKNAAADPIIDEERESDEKQAPKVNMDDEIDVDGESMPIRELMNRYSKAMKKNAEDEDDKKKKEKEKDDKENSKDSPENYYKLLNARNTETVQKIELTQDKVARGANLYGTSK